jgi:hypothetical protein
VTTEVEPFDGQELLNSDIIIPRLCLMQGQSELVKHRKAQDGDMVRVVPKTTNMEIVGGPDKSIEIIPLKLTSDWVLQEDVRGKFEFRKVEARTAATENYPWDFYRDADGKEATTPFLGATRWKRTKTLNLLALLSSDIERYLAEIKKFMETGEAPDLNKTLLPVMISFRSTSFPAGQGVATFYAQVRDMMRYTKEVKGHHYSLNLSCKMTENDKGQFFIFQIGKASKINKAFLEEANRWYTILNSSMARNIRVAEEEAETAAPEPVYNKAQANAGVEIQF